MDFDAVLIAPRRAAMIRAGYWRDKTVNDHFDAVLATRPDALAVSSISAADGGRRDFTSSSQMVAGRYDVLCQPRNAEKARELLAKLAMGPGAAASEPPA